MNQDTTASQVFCHKRNDIALILLMAITLSSIAVGQASASPRKPVVDQTRYHLAVLCDDNVPLSEKLNDHGQMIGEGGNWRHRPFAALPGLDQRRDFGSFPRPQGCSYVMLGGVNNRGEVTGVYVFEVSGAWIIDTYDAFIWRRGKITSTAADFIPHAINDRGEVVGEFQDNTPSNENPTDAVLWKQGKTIDLGQGCALDINEAGVVVGNTGRGNDESNIHHALLWRGRRVTDLGALAGGQSNALAINNHNLIVGYSTLNASVTHAVLWRNGQILDLGSGTINSSASSVSDSGLIVGAARLPGGDRAVLWRAGKMFDLNRMLAGAPGWILTEAEQINSRGQIVAAAKKNGKTYCVLLTLIVGSAARPNMNP